MKSTRESDTALATALLACCTLLSSVAHGADRRRPSSELEDPSGKATWETLRLQQKRGAMRVIRCARSLTQGGGMVPGGMLAAEILQDLVTGISDADTIDRIGDECDQTLSDLASGVMEQEDPGFERFKAAHSEWLQVPAFPYGTGITSTPLSEGVAKSLVYFLLATEWFRFDCTLVGPEVVAALGLGLEVGASAGLCTRSDGRRWLALGASAGAGVGFGLMLGGVHSNTKSSPRFGGIAPSATLAFANGVGTALVSTSGSQHGATDLIGLGIFGGIRADLSLHLIPVGDARKLLLTRLLE